jgi:aminoglycoside phosphotransferase (APT) family kinase protein
MELLAQGRECDVYDLGDGTVLRRSRRQNDQGYEAKILSYAAEQGYPVPRVHEVRDGGNDLVMEKVEGPTMLQAIERQPWKIGAHGRLLGELHVRLHELPGPDFVPQVDGGDRFLHFDLHPLNVILSPRGPVVIDWTNACCGPPGTDIARAWALMAAAEGEVDFPLNLVLGPARRWLLRSFLGVAGRDDGVSGLRYGVELTMLDPNISEAEKALMQALAETEGV